MQQNMMRIWPAALVLIGGGMAAPGFCARQAKEIHPLVQFVDPFIGVRGGGACVIGPQLPYGSVNPSPDTPAGGCDGYDPGQPIRGFSQTHVSGTGGQGKYGNFLISPQIGLETSEAGHDSPKSEEVATASYYSARLTRYDIKAELTPTRHAALYRFTFPASSDAHISIDLAHQIPGDSAPNDTVFSPGSYLEAGDVTVNEDDGSMQGWAKPHGGWSPQSFPLYFYAKVSKAPKTAGTWTNGTRSEGGDKATVAKSGDRIGGYFGFATTAGETISMKIAVSFTSVAQAKKYLDTETPEYDFDGTRAAADAAWNKALSAVLIDDPGADNNQLKIFYTALYHATLMPRNRTGDNPWGYSGPYYDDHYCVWDTFRTVFPLMLLVDETSYRGNILSFLERFRHHGMIGDAYIAGAESQWGEQGGNDPDNILADAFVKGVQGIDPEMLYAALKNDADTRRNPLYRQNDRGWTPIGGVRDWYNVPVARSLEYSYNDFCVAEVARGLGYQADYQRYLARSKKWETYWDPSASSNSFTGFMHGRNADGSWAEYDPAHWTNYLGPQFYEGSAWDYSYTVYHDFARLIALAGGPAAFVKRTQFAIEKPMLDAGNEPGFMVVRSLHYAGRPDLTSLAARRLMNGYTLDGYPGDEDSGAMGAWYVLSALGLFPNAGQNVYLLNTPRFRRMILQRENGARITIETDKDPGDPSLVIQAASLNGKPLRRSWLTHQQIADGALIQYRLGPEPASWGTTSLPPSVSDRSLAALPAKGAARPPRPSPPPYFQWKTVYRAESDPRPWIQQDGGWTIANGGFTVQAAPGPEAFASAANFDDFRLDAEITVGASGDAGLIFRADMSKTAQGFRGYYAGLSARDGVILGEARPDWSPLGGAPLKIEPGSRHHLRITANGVLIQVFVDDMEDPKVWAATTDYEHGGIGVRTWNADAVIDHLAVSVRRQSTGRTSS